MYSKASDPFHGSTILKVLFLVILMSRIGCISYYYSVREATASGLGLGGEPTTAFN